MKPLDPSKRKPDPLFKTRTLGLSASLFAASLVIAGCGTEQAGSEPQEAPSVDQPLDTATFEKDPCRSLAPSQTQGLGMSDTEGEPELDSDIGASCTWSSVSTNTAGSLLSVAYPPQGNGLGSLYAKRETYPHFRELPQVSGYPAVVAMNGQAPPEQAGTCDLNVGIADDRMVTIHTAASSDQSADKADPCGKAQQVAGEVVKTLQSGK